MDDSQQQYIVVELEQERYALPVSDIYEIIKMQKITGVPNSRSYLEGVTNLRGKILPIISLRKRFGMEEQGHGKKTRIVVVSCNEEMVGMIVDSVQHVLCFERVEHSIENVTGTDSRYFAGIGHLEDGDFITILNIKNILH